MTLGLAACSGGSDEATPPTTTTAAPAAPTTRPAPTIDLSQPIPGGSLHGTPRPPLENTGDDYVAVFRSITANFRWVTENPDVAIISELFVPGTPPHDQRRSAYRFLVDNRYRWADEGYLLVSVEVVDVQGSLVSLRVVDEMLFERLVDSSGNQVGDVRPHDGPTELSILMSRNDGVAWRIADSKRIETAEVDL